MATEEYSTGYEEGRQDGWDAAMESLPAQRTWVALTEQELNACWDDLLGTDAFTRDGITRAIEAKLKEKNNG